MPAGAQSVIAARRPRVVVLVTAHPEIDYADVAARSALFVDLRGGTRGLPVENVIRL